MGLYRKASDKRKRKTLETMSFKELVSKLDHCFSEYIRLKAADSNGYVRCPTCGKTYLWKDMDLSHYIGRQYKSVRWDERNVIAQCQSENRFQSGNIFKMRQVLVSRYGEEAIKEVEGMAHKSCSEDVITLRMKIIEYREKVKKLKEEKGYFL